MSFSIDYINNNVYTTILYYPLESLQSLFSNTKIMKEIYQDKEFKVKTFLGSNHNINGSGFIWSGLENFSLVLISNVIINMDFSTTYVYKISHLNEQALNEDVFFEIHLIKNTCENATIIKCNFRYRSNLNITLIKHSFQKISFIIKKFCDKLKDYLIDSQELYTGIIHSIIIKRNYKETYNFYKNIRNFCKSIGTENQWEIFNCSYEKKSKNVKDNNHKNKNCSVKVNEDTIINYSIIKEEEKKDEYLSYISTKTCGKIACLNGWLKFTFHKIDENTTLLIHETKIPVNTASPIFNTLNNYTLYCLKKCKNYLESLNIKIKKGQSPIENEENTKIIKEEESLIK